MNKPVLPNDTQPAEEALPPAGHNNPPPYDLEAFAALTKTADDFLKGADIWRKTDIASEAMAEQLSDMIAGLRKNAKAVEDARVAAKKPHDDASDAVQAAFKPLAERYKRALEVMLAKAKVWVDKKKAEEAERKRKAQEEADALAAAAKLKEMETAQSGNIDAQLEAERAAKEAEKAQKAASKDVKVGIGSASGAGRTISSRSRKVCTLTAIGAAFLHYRNDPKVAEMLTSLANAEANAKGFEGDIPGFDIKTVESAV
ncbi:MAG: hypothetical protein KDK24_10130 [Pseudooceanicola sp.]|nr:hypothetical protein [Pseudooceanicola sp.]